MTRSKVFLFMGLLELFQDVISKLEEFKFWKSLMPVVTLRNVN